MNNNKKGFTLAEVLITLTIIGVVAALTIPSLLANVSDKTYDAKRRGLETRMAQAISQMDSLNSYEAVIPDGYTGSESAAQYSEKYSSMNFVTEGLSKVIKITNICEFEKYAACDFPSAFSNFYSAALRQTKSLAKMKDVSHLATAANLTGNSSGIITDPVVIKTKNGESMLVYYNPSCIPEQSVPNGGSKIWLREICALMVIDLDGAKKGPNTLGKDVQVAMIYYPDTPYFKLPPLKAGGSNGAVPSYSDDEENNESASGRCEKLGGGNRYMLMPKEWFYVTVFDFENWAPNKDWTASVEGAGPDDYAWMVTGAKAILARRDTIGGHLMCGLKDQFQQK